MRVLLINPPMSSGWKPYQILPVGLCYLKASLIRAGIECKVVDMGGSKDEEAVERVKEYKPDIVGITTFTESRGHSINIAGLIKTTYPKISVGLGGVHVSSMYKQILDNYSWVDWIAIGESEKSFIDWCLGKISEDIIEGTKIQNLDELPFPDYSNLELEKYIDRDGPCKGKKLAPLLTSRGCPFNCIYCSSHANWRNWRYRSIPNVLQEIRHLRDKYGYETFSIMDDIFSANEKRTVEFCIEASKLRPRVNWKVQTRADCVSLSTLKLMKETGCWMVVFGVESGSPTILENLNKKEKIEDVINAFTWANRVGLKTTFNCIIGSPGETKATVEESKEVVRKCKPTYVSTANLRMYPGTKLWEVGKLKGLVQDKDLLDIDRECFYYTEAMSLKEMTKYNREVRVSHAKQNGLKGYWELVKFGTDAIISTPGKVLKGV